MLLRHSNYIRIWKGKKMKDQRLCKLTALLLSSSLLLSICSGCTQKTGAEKKATEVKQGAEDKAGNGTGKEGESGVTDLMEGIEADSGTVSIDNQGNAGEKGAASEEFRADAADFAIALLRESLEETEGNIMVSPVSVLAALAMTANGADGETLAQMISVLAKSQGLDGLNENLKAWMDGLNSDGNAGLTMANAIWFNGDQDLITVEESFLQKNKAYFDADIYRTVFDENAVREINRWAQEQTNGEIEQIIEQMPEDAVMYLLNATVFDGEWEIVYEKEQVRDAVFTNASGEEETVSMMYSKEYRYIEDEKAAGFVKPYKEGYHFVAILPNEGISPEEYVRSLDGEHLLSMISQAGMEGIEELCVCLPKFRAEYEAELSANLITMGIVDAFDVDKADFHNLGSAGAGRNILIDAIFHKTYIAVDELGTKAGAVTAVAMAAGTALWETTYVYLDRPFVYAIVEEETNIPVFIGIVNTVNG